MISESSWGDHLHLSTFRGVEVKKNDPNTPGKKYDDYWETSQKEILQDPKALLDRLFNFDKDNIPDRVIQAQSSTSTVAIAQAITPYMEREDFDPVAIKKVWLLQHNIR